MQVAKQLLINEMCGRVGLHDVINIIKSYLFYDIITYLTKIVHKKRIMMRDISTIICRYGTYMSDIGYYNTMIYVYWAYTEPIMTKQGTFMHNGCPLIVNFCYKCGNYKDLRKVEQIRCKCHW